MNLEEYKKIYFIGIGGIGISAIARLLKEKGKDIAGSDLKPSEITVGLEKIGIKINYCQKEGNISNDVDLVIYTSAVPENNPELQSAKSKGIKYITYFESLGLVFNEKFGISICGTHGKSTTSAMIGLALEDGCLDPSVLVGSIVPRYDSNLRIGNSKYFVAESCEYQGHFLYLYPDVIVLNNIELDHTDYYKDIEDMKETFFKFLSQVSDDGTIIYNGDDENCLEVVGKVKVNKPNVKFVSFGKGIDNDFYFSGYSIKDGKSEFDVFNKEKNLGKFYLKFPGEFNVYNALATISLAVFLDVDIEKVRKSLSDFSGIWRRFEIKGKYKKSLVISDYAHHPTAVKFTIEAAKSFYPDKKIFTVFQPHQHNRTKNLYKDFVNCFSGSDKLLLVEIYDVAGREEKEDQVINSKILAEDVRKKGEGISKVLYAKNLDETKDILNSEVEDDDVILIMGAGDIYLVANDISQE